MAGITEILRSISLPTEQAGITMVVHKTTALEFLGHHVEFSRGANCGSAALDCPPVLHRFRKENTMITLNAANARIKRQLIEKQAGESYLSSLDIRDRIGYFREDFDEQFLFGIYDSPNKWTVLSVKKLYACYDGDPFYLVLNKDTDEIDEYARNVGRKDFIDWELTGGRKIWMKTVGLSCAIRNIILMLEKLPDNAHLE